MGKIGPIRSGLWLIVWQMLFVGAGMAIFWACAEDRPIISASGIVGGTILSRLGLRGFDLSVQLIIQEVSPRLLQALSLLSRLYLPELT
jgi:iron-regulated transporter 1